MKKTFALATISLICGCTVTKYQSGDASFTRTAFGNKTQISELEVTVSPKGKTLRLKGYKNDQVEMMIEAAKLGAAAAKAGAGVP